MSVQSKVDKIFDSFWAEHRYRDLHGLNINTLQEELEKLAAKVDKKLDAIRDECGDHLGRSGKYISDMCKI